MGKCTPTFKSVSSDSAVMDLGICHKDIIRKDYTKICVCCCSVTKSHLTLCDTWIAAQQASHPSLSPGVCSDSCPLTQWCYLNISTSAALFSSQNQGLLQWVNSSHQVAKVLEHQLQNHSFQGIYPQYLLTVDLILI